MNVSTSAKNNTKYGAKLDGRTHVPSTSPGAGEAETKEAPYEKRAVRYFWLFG
jgi:hypothetical protein